MGRDGRRGHGCARIPAGALRAGCGRGRDAAVTEGLTLEDVALLVRPVEAELRWTRIPWRGDLWEGRVEALATGRPLFVWAMNGHPLGCV